MPLKNPQKSVKIGHGGYSAYPTTTVTVMLHRYFLIEPQYADPDVFCHITIGSGRVRASIAIYANLVMFEEVAAALTAPTLSVEHPGFEEDGDDDGLFDFHLSVLPHDGGSRGLRFRIYQDLLDDGAPYRADIRFELTQKEAEEFAKELKIWCSNPECRLIWK